ncbi:unnamed protein product [Adineta steineri]|uniref:Phosducin domain-containing protein n=1 Tax=Adineta steineri TaxID=433720 RepID=A0A814IH89_9BILA|nr:unnamed protein product [Adineta steineri]CAF1129986.1 unnamed protein product [Adineta steineri]
MAINSHSRENLDFLLLDNVNPSNTLTEEISTRIFYDFNPFETFCETFPSESSTQLYNDVFEDIPDINEMQLITSTPSLLFISKNTIHSYFLSSIGSVDVVYKLLKEASEAFHPTEQNNPAYNLGHVDEQLAMNKTTNDSLPVIQSFLKKSSKSAIPLSENVAVTDLKSNRLKIVYELENIYRPRYKSDYFPQTGSARHPRYITDNKTNHFITLQLPSDYQYDLQYDYIRVALITTSIEGHGHYYSPYKFQKDHNDINVPDENPMYIKIEANREDQSKMRLYLVLIKSKLHHLNYVQPLKLFSDTTANIQNIIHEEILRPKELITKYQLDKSQIAFTLCKKLSDDSYTPYPDSTIISSIITEVPTSKKTNDVTANTSVSLLDLDVAGTCDQNDLFGSIGHPAEIHESNGYIPAPLFSNSPSDIDQNLLVNNSLPVYPIEKNKKVRTQKKAILLSSSVGVGQPKQSSNPSNKIKLVHDLEEKYRPRYKSDYFANNGTTRKPRYVTDRDGNHYISLQVPQHMRGPIRIDWVTIPNEDNERFVMPYQFQASNDLTDVPDCNPIYEQIQSNSSGLMKIYLVLIKAKQDALKVLQPLQPFHPIADALGLLDKQIYEKAPKLTPKNLIKKYQLTKSQLAFTLCTLSSDGKTCDPEWDTTVYSTVLEEEGNTENSATKIISCPKCSCSINIDIDEPKTQEMTGNKRKSKQFIGEKLAAEKDPNANTQWNDQLRRFGIIGEKEEKEDIKTEDERLEISRAEQLDKKTLDELDELEDEDDERVLQEYRRKRLLELQEKATRARFGEVIEISAIDYVKEVNQAGSDIWVVLYLYKSGLPICSLISDHLRSLAIKYPQTKFVKSISTVCIPNYPDKNLPTVFIYNNGDLKHSLIGPFAFGGMKCRFEHLEYKLYEFGAIETTEKLTKPDDMKNYGANDAADDFLRSSIRQSMKNDSDDDD